MTSVPSAPTSDSRWREAVREALVLALLSLAIAFLYNGLTGKGLFQASTPPISSTSPTGTPEIIPLEQAVSLHADGSALFVDARHAFDYRIGHIPGAINAPLNESDAIIAGLSVPKDRPVVVYCDGAECNSSLEVGAKFSAAGFSKVYVFFSGWSAWKESGHAVVGETP